jgi:hypothetical protein
MSNHGLYQPTMQKPLTQQESTVRSRVNQNTLFGLFVCCIAASLWIPRLTGPIDFRWDGAVYYILGTSLANDGSYKLLNEPGEIQETQYPPALPAFIAAHQLILGSSDPVVVGPVLRISFCLIFILYIYAVFQLLKNYLPLNYAFWATLICLLYFQSYFLSDLCFPEIPFALCTVLLVLCNQKSNRAGYFLLTAFLGFIAYGLRTMAIALLAAWVTESLLSKQFKQMSARMFLAILPVLCWQGYIHHVETGKLYNSPSYLYQRADYMFYNVSYAKNIFRLKDPFVPELGNASLRDIAIRFLSNPKEILLSFGGTVSCPPIIWEAPWKMFRMPFPFSTPWPAYLVLIALGCLVLIGIYLLIVEREWFITSYIAYSVFLIALTPWPAQFSRYLTPLAPFLALSFFKTILSLRNKFQKMGSVQWKLAGLTITSCIVCVIFFMQISALFLIYVRRHQPVTYEDGTGKKITYRLFFYQDSYRALDDGLDWLKKRAEPSSIIALSMPHWAYLRTHLKAVMAPLERDPQKAQILLDSVPVKYLILDHGLAVDTRWYMSPVVRNYPDRWKRIYTDSIEENDERIPDGFEIYERVNATSGTSSD